jgi:ferredoxin-thioredoxin reductase catalytic chain
MTNIEKTNQLYISIKSLADKRGYFLNPDIDFAMALAESLVINNERYGYEACPCRLSTGIRANDLDIICPCDYRDADLSEFGACYCGLYVNKSISEGKQTLRPIPERRKTIEISPTPKATGGKGEQMTNDDSKIETQNSKLGKALPIWRCTVCGYLCARTESPEICPICGAAHDRFEIFS